MQPNLEIPIIFLNKGFERYITSCNNGKYREFETVAPIKNVEPNDKGRFPYGCIFYPFKKKYRFSAENVKDI